MSWVCSSFGRAPALQAGGSRFDPDLIHYGALAQLEERYLGKVEVRGSAPLGSTMINKSLNQQLADGDIDAVEFEYLSGMMTTDSDKALELSIGLKQYREMHKIT